MAKRRANGEGSIRKRKDGRWEGRYTAGHDPVTGKAIYKNVLGKTQAEVKEKLKSAIEKNGSLVTITKQYTVGQWLDVWMENYAKLQVRPSSLKTYQGFISNHIKPTLGDMPLEKLTTMDLQRLHKHLLENGRVECTESCNKPKGLSVKTVRNINQMIFSALNCAVEQRLIPANPTKGCVLPKLERKEMKILPPESLGPFFEEARRSSVFELYYYFSKITPSFSNSGRPHDNAVAESFFASLKKEELYRKDYLSEPDFRRSISAYMEFYNMKRPHRTLKNRMPCQMEEDYQGGHGPVSWKMRLGVQILWIGLFVF